LKKNNLEKSLQNPENFLILFELLPQHKCFQNSKNTEIYNCSIAISNVYKRKIMKKN